MFKGKNSPQKGEDRLFNKEVNPEVIKQFHYLQSTLGNKKVEELVKSGVLEETLTGGPALKLKNEQEKQAAIDQEAIRRDRDALAGEIQKEVQKKKAVGEQLAAASPGKDVYVNVTTERHHVTLPGNKDALFYHYTDLKDVSFSYENLNSVGQPKRVNRGEVVTETFSFLYEPETARNKPEESESNQLEDEVPEEEAPLEQQAEESK